MTHNGLNTFQGITAMVTTMMGSGVIMLPSAFGDVGYVFGTLQFVSTSIISFFTLYAISSAAVKMNKNEKQTYYSVCKNINKFMAVFADLCIALQGYSCCLVYMIALATWIPKLIGKEISRFYMVMIFLPPLYYLASLKNLKNLRYVSFLSVGSVTYLASLILYYSLLTRGKYSEGEKVNFNYKFNSALSVIIFALGCHQNIIKVYSELQNKSLKNITLISGLSVLFGSSIYLVIGFFGYFIAGSSIDGSILDSFLDKSTKLSRFLIQDTFDKFMILNKIAVICFCCVMMSAFPTQQQPAKDSVINLIFLITKKPRNESSEDTMRKILTFIFCITVGILACIPDLDFDSVLKFIGATAATSITYIIPSLVYIFTNHYYGFLRVSAIVVAIISTLLMIYMVIFNFTEDDKS
ncbi:transmembrane amino acid transporter [Hamiltosporidium tvaerminnensis]|uniref:Transmembrane amino acid transporter n=1 Tax=Hamiltosporidium tvaerminnensis TaxID=1176355 RepID=A0A4Q9LCK7_9MICR|nr:hypothetical protein LUQ84_000548 [Hamiltosporidium tvaerminnensis]TBU04801.1 transmembrane amino acid transporter [Hamiltosporidium tvaerminnensis]